MRLQIILAGLGGQGILFAGRLFSELGMKLGLNVMGSETHGMSQRRGSVITHLKLGNFYSPMIREGTADILYSFEQNETYNTLKFLKRGSAHSLGGVCFANLPDTFEFAPKILAYLKENGIVVKTCDADGIAFKLGAVISANIVLIGYSFGTGLIPFKYEDIKSVLMGLSKREYKALNIKALELGRNLGTTNNFL